MTTEFATSSQPLRFAIVEDDLFIGQLLSHMLDSAGFDSEFFPFGTDLLKSPNLLNFDAIILDLSLPDMDGFVVMQRLAESTIGMPVLLISGHDVAVLHAAKLYGNGIGLKMRGALTKPFSEQEFFAAFGLKG